MVGSDTFDLLDRYARACDLKQPVDQSKIEAALLLWAREIGAPSSTKITFVQFGKEIAWAASAARAARAARAASAAWAASAARAASAASAAWAASAARAAWAAWAARAAWDAWDASWISITAIGAVSVDDQATAKIWLPVLSAFEAGAFAFWVTDAEIFVATIPAKVSVDDRRRLHSESGPAFVWLSDIADCYWHGVHIPDHWISRRDDLTAAEIFKQENAETRRAGCEIIGWDRVLAGIDATLIDDDGDPQIGILYEGQIPGASRCGFLKVQCGTGRIFVQPVPAGVGSAIAAQAFIRDVSVKDWIKPEVRT